MAEGGLQSSSECCSYKDEKAFMLLMPDDSAIRRHSFHEVRRPNETVDLDSDTTRRNSSYPESEFNKNRHSSNYGYDEEILKIEDEFSNRRRHHHHHHNRRRQSRSHHKQHHARRFSNVVDDKLRQTRKYSRRKSSARTSNLIDSHHSNNVKGRLS